LKFHQFSKICDDVFYFTEPVLLYNDQDVVFAEHMQLNVHTTTLRELKTRLRASNVANHLDGSEIK